MTRNNLILFEENRRLREEIQKLSARILQLEELLNTNSQNSSTPPSQDPFRRPRQTPLSGRKQGGQPGHQGHYRQMVPLEAATRIIDVKPDRCPHCRTSAFALNPVAVKQRQVVELSTPASDVTQYNVYICRCDKCGRKVKAEIPPEARSCFGPRLKAFLTMLAGTARMTKRIILAVISHLGVNISLGSICNIHRLAGSLLQKPSEEIRAAVLQSSNVNADESSWKLKNISYWLWVGATPIATFFYMDPSRSRAAFQTIFHGFSNTLTSDRYGAYNLYPGGRQACLAHIRRDFIKMSERPNADGAIGRILCDQLDTIFSYWKQFKAGTLLRSNLQQQTQESIDNIKLALTVGAAADKVCSKTAALCHDLLSRFETLWTFVSEENVEPTNNLAERNLRPAVIYRKLTGGSQSEWGLKFVERLLTITCTCKQRAKNVFAFLTDIFHSHSCNGPAPPIFD